MVANFFITGACGRDLGTAVREDPYSYVNSIGACGVSFEHFGPRTEPERSGLLNQSWAGDRHRPSTGGPAVSQVSRCGSAVISSFSRSARFNTALALATPAHVRSWWVSSGDSAMSSFWVDALSPRGT